MSLARKYRIVQTSSPWVSEDEQDWDNTEFCYQLIYVVRRKFSKNIHWLNILVNSKKWIAKAGNVLEKMKKTESIHTVCLITEHALLLNTGKSSLERPSFIADSRTFKLKFLSSHGCNWFPVAKDENIFSRLRNCLLYWRYFNLHFWDVEASKGRQLPQFTSAGIKFFCLLCKLG